MRIHQWIVSALLLIPSLSLADVCSTLQSHGPNAELTESVRARILCDLREVVGRKYASLEIKKTRLGVDLLAHLTSCVERELKISDISQITFQDRALECMAAFQDTHIITSSQTANPFVVSGVSLRKVGDQIVIAGYDQKLIKITNEAERLSGGSGGLEGRLKPGTVVEKIDGQDPYQVVAQLAKYINGSSPAFVEAQAVKAITRREFAYPSQLFLQLKLAGQDQPIHLRWYVFPVALRQDLRDLLLTQLGMKILAPFGFSRTRDPDGFGDGYVGYDERQPLTDQITTEYALASGKPAMRFGDLDSACYAQILDSDSDKVMQVPVSSHGEVKNHTVVLGQFLKQCQTEGKKLVLDLRYNGGGDFDIPIADFRLLIPDRSTILGSAFTSGRYTRHLFQLFEIFNLGPQVPFKDWSRFSSDRFYRAVDEARVQGLTHISAIPEPNVRIPITGVVFSGPVTVVTSEYCISGCEIMAGLLKNRPNTTIVGRPTNGTGGMVFKNKLYPLAAGFRDDLYSSIQVRLPNNLFGVLSAPVQDGSLIPFGQVENLIRENLPLPVTSGFEHDLTVEDIESQNQALKTLIKKTL
ncbi:MAG: S41 family peptidase [Bdellovibrionales bacterium]